MTSTILHSMLSAQANRSYNLSSRLGNITQPSLDLQVPELTSTVVVSYTGYKITQPHTGKVKTLAGLDTTNYDQVPAANKIRAIKNGYAMAAQIMLASKLSHKTESLLSTHVREQWVMFLVTYLHLLYPDVSKGRKVGDSLEEMPNELKLVCLAIDRSINGVTAKDEDKVKNVDRALSPAQLDGLRNAMAALNMPGFVTRNPIGEYQLATPANAYAKPVGELIQVASEMAMACNIGLLLYLCGRPLTENGESAINSRPKNLQDRQYHKQAQSFLTGAWKMTAETATMIGALWESDAELRWGCFAGFIPLASKAMGPVNEAVGLMVGMCQMAQLSHVTICTEFCEAFPFVQIMSTLQREMTLLKNGFDIIESIARDQPWLIPYLKVLLRDRLKAWDSKALLPMTSLATTVQQTDTNKLGSYAGRLVSNNTVKAEFDRLKAAWDIAAAGPTSSQPTVAIPSVPQQTPAKAGDEGTTNPEDLVPKPDETTEINATEGPAFEPGEIAAGGS